MWGTKSPALGLLLMVTLVGAVCGVRLTRPIRSPHLAQAGEAASRAWYPTKAREGSPTLSASDEQRSVTRALGDAPLNPNAMVPTATTTLHGSFARTGRAHGVLPKRANVQWTFEAKGSIQTQVVTSPDEQTLYVASLGGDLIALDRNGAPRWTLDLGDRIYATPTVSADGAIYVGSDSKKFASITPEGKIKWQLDTEADADTSAVITSEGQIVFASGDAVIAVRKSGEVAWRFHAKKKIFTSPALLADDTILVGSQDDHVYALTKRGDLRWSFNAGADVDGGPAVGDDQTIFIGTDNGEVIALAQDGSLRWRTRVGGFVRGAVSVARNGDVLAGVYGPQPKQVRLRANDGALVGAFALHGTRAREFGIHGGALEDDRGALIFGAQDDAVYAINPTGDVGWKFLTAADVDAPLTLLSDGSVVAASDDHKVYFFASASE